jgi:CBS-domain-containing membrane protein
MTTAVETISDQDSVVRANELMWRKQMHHLIVKRGDQVVGVLSDTDLGGPEADTIPDDLQVHKVMSTQLVTARPDTTVKDAVNLMRGHQIHCLPVMDEANNLVGIVTTSDIQTLEKRGTAHPAFQGTQPIDDYVPLQKRNQRGAKSQFGHSEWPDQAPSH